MSEIPALIWPVVKKGFDSTLVLQSGGSNLNFRQNCLLDARKWNRFERHQVVMVWCDMLWIVVMFYDMLCLPRQFGLWCMAYPRLCRLAWAQRAAFGKAPILSQNAAQRSKSFVAAEAFPRLREYFEEIEVNWLCATIAAIWRSSNCHQHRSTPPLQEKSTALMEFGSKIPSLRHSSAGLHSRAQSSCVAQWYSPHQQT